MGQVKAYDSTKQATSIILNQFSNILLPITDTEDYQVPIKFSTASRLMKKLSKIDKSFTYRVPIMSLEYNGSTIDNERKTNPRLKRKQLEIDTNNVTITWNDVPTNYEFTLTIIGDSLTTLSTINEYIISSFRNNVIYTQFITPLGEVTNVPIILGDISAELDNNEDSFDDNRLLSNTITLTLESFVHSQISTDSKYIKTIDMELYNNQKAVEEYMETFTI